MRKFFPRRFHVILLVIVGLTTLVFLASLPPNTPSSTILAHPFFHYNLSAEEPEDPTQSCVIPRFHPFHPSIWGYLTVTRPIRCTVRTPTLTYVDGNGWLRINGSALEESGYHIGGGSFVKKLKCQWRPVLRSGSDQSDDDHVTYGREVDLDGTGANISAYEYVSVKCWNFAGVSVYENLHAHIANITALHRPDYSTRDHQSLVNILIIGLDSMSRQAFMRLMPNTYRYLTETLSSFVFTGMNKVGDNTFPNLIALLTGQAAYGPNLPDDSSGFDDWPLVWRNYSDAGYVTMWAEDFPDFGLFNYLAKGFRKPPVHHYLRPFWLAVKESSTLRMSSHMCFGNVPRHQLQLEYVQRFVKRYSKERKTPYFAFSFLAELSHEYLSQVAAADSDFEGLFKFLFENGYLNDTLLIVMSDHGHRFDAMRSTHVGRLEERLPFFAMRVPKPLVDSGHVLRQLERNRGRLTTPYDTHATLVDVLDHVTKGSPLGSYRAQVGLGRTLFGPIPANRTCEDAGIPLHYCVCEPEEPIPVDDSRVRAAVRVLFNHVNALLRNVRDFCSELLPGSVISAQLLNSEDKDIAEDRGLIRHRIRIAVAAQPSNAIFEATVEVRNSNRSRSSRPRNTVVYEARVLGDVSRINKYGNQSSCIRHDILRKYCYCQKPPVRWATKGTIPSRHISGS